MNATAVAVPMLFLAAAVASYALHGVLRDTDNQLARPHRLGGRQIHGRVISLFVYGLAAGEIGGFTVLFAGFAQSLTR